MCMKSNKEKTSLPLWKFTVCAVCVLLIWVAWMKLGMCAGWTKPEDWAKPEALSALFTGLAFVAMFFALRIQSEELALQRKELQCTREELKRTAEANEKSAELAGKAIRANWLSKWLEEHREKYNDNGRKYDSYTAQLYSLKSRMDAGEGDIDLSPYESGTVAGRYAKIEKICSVLTAFLDLYASRLDELEKLSEEVAL